MDAVALETYVRLRWFIKLRWVAIAGTIAAVAFFDIYSGMGLFKKSMWAVILGMILCNFLFLWIAVKMPDFTYASGQRVMSASAFANLQIGVDIIFLTLIWHFYGGIENPMMFFYVFHMIIASILLPRLTSYFWAVFSSMAIILVAYLEYSGRISHNTVINKLTGIGLWDNVYFNVIILSAFCFTLLCVVYMTSTITLRLRRRIKENVELEKQITERKLQDTEKKLFFSEKMAALGKLAAGMAHEINNPLTTILSYSECLADEVKGNEEAVNDFKLIIGETIRIRGIVRKVLDFARADDETQAAPIDVNREIRSILDMIQPQMDFINIQFTLCMCEVLPRAIIGKEQFKQVIINILVNASQAMNTKGKVVIETNYNKQTNSVSIIFIDTGHGILPEDLTRIFDPFFTTKKQGEGTGLGLSESYGLVRMHGGNISAESEYGKGATFTLMLPAVLPK